MLSTVDIYVRYVIDMCIYIIAGAAAEPQPMASLKCQGRQAANEEAQKASTVSSIIFSQTQ